MHKHCILFKVYFTDVIVLIECDCDVTGTSSIQELGCDGGYCLCKDGIGGERCDRCLNGYYNFSINGCTGMYFTSVY